MFPVPVLSSADCQLGFFLSVYVLLQIFLPTSLSLFSTNLLLFEIFFLF